MVGLVHLMMSTPRYPACAEPVRQKPFSPPHSLHPTAFSSTPPRLLTSMDHDHHDSDSGRERGTLQTRRSLPAHQRARRGGFLDAAGLHRLRRSTPSTPRPPTAPRRSSPARTAPILVVLQQAGGNDGLNMLPPWADDAYHRARPTLGLAADKIHKLDGYCGLHPALTPIKALYDEGHVAVIQGVGYPNPNRSHFRSTEIWQTASDSATANVSNGWLGHVFRPAAARVRAPTVGVSIGGADCRRRSASPHPTGISFRRPGEIPLDRSQLQPARSAGGRRPRRVLPPNEPARRGRRRRAGPRRRQHGGAAPSGPITGGNNQHPGSMSSLDFLERTALDAQLSSGQACSRSRARRKSDGRLTRPTSWATA